MITLPAHGLFDRFPELLRHAREPSEEDVRRFAALLPECDPGLFGCVQILRSQDTRRWVGVRQTSAQAPAAESWQRWPVGRLFARRRACIITNPHEAKRALAVPFAVRRNEYYIVVAEIAQPVLTAARQLFVDAICSVTLGVGGAQAFGQQTALPEHPSVVWFGKNDAQRERVQDILNERGVQMRNARSLRHALALIEDDYVDVAIVSAQGRDEALKALRALRHAAGTFDVPILLFDDWTDADEVDVLVERRLPHGAPAESINRAIKELLGLLPQRRTEALLSLAQSYAADLQRCTDAAAIAAVLVRAAIEMGAEAAYGSIMDRTGALHTATAPEGVSLPEGAIPDTFLDGKPLIAPVVDAEFYERFSDDRETVDRMRRLAPQSAACLPLISAGRIAGTLTALTMRARLGGPHFTAFEALCDVAARALHRIERRTDRSGDREAPLRASWRHVLLRNVQIDAYVGQHSSCSIQLAPASTGSAALICYDARSRDLSEAAGAKILKHTLAVFDATGYGMHALRQIDTEEYPGALLAALLTEDGRIYYRCENNPAPLEIRGTGPSPLLSDDLVTRCGLLDLHSDSALVLYSAEFARCVDTAQLLRALHEGRLPREPHAPRAGFVCVTMPESD